MGISESQFSEVVAGWNGFGIGADCGFVSGPRRLRENNVQGGVAATWRVHEHARLFGHISHSRALTNLDREGEGDTSWGGLGVELTF